MSQLYPLTLSNMLQRKPVFDIQYRVPKKCKNQSGPAIRQLYWQNSYFALFVISGIRNLWLSNDDDNVTLI